jgi:G3E family GTPase
VTSVGIDAGGSVDTARLDTWLGGLLATRGPDLFRSKGVLNLADSDRRYVFQGVHMLHDGELGAPWGDGESRRSRMVFIGRNLDRAELTGGFLSCLVGASAEVGSR